MAESARAGEFTGAGLSSGVAWFAAARDSFLRALAAQSGRGFLWLVVSFGAGATLFFTWTADPPWWLGPAAALAGIAIAVLRRHGTWLAVGAALAMAGLGHGAAQLRTWVIDAPVLDHQVGPFQLRGQVIAAEKRPAGNHVVLSHVALPDMEPAATPDAVRITLPASHGLPVVGSRMGVRAVIGPVGRPVAPGTFQFQRFLYFQGIGASGFAVGRWYRLGTPLSESLDARFHDWTEALRRAIGDRFAALLPGPEGTVAAALINGEQSAIPQSLQESYRISGIAHILSVSGVHLSLLAAIVFFCIRRGLALFPAIALHIDTKKAAAWVSLMATAFYLVISGMSVPAVRSFLMVATVLLAVLVDRSAVSLRNVAWAALILMAIYPDAISGASFQMSFLAVLSLVALYEQGWAKVSFRAADGGIDLPRAAAAYFAGLVIADLAAGGATALFAAYHFNRLPTYSMFTNLLAAPLTSLWIMPSAVAALVLMPFGLDAWAVELMGRGVALLDGLANWVAAWHGAQVHIPPMPAPLMAGAAAGVIFMCLWNGRMRWLGIAPVVLAFICAFRMTPPDLLVDDSGRVVAVSDARGHLAIRPGRAGRFVREVWTGRYGLSEQAWPRLGRKGEAAENQALGLACDPEGCLFSRNGKRVFIAARPEAASCAEADLFIINGDPPATCNARVVGRSVLKRSGAQAIWLEPAAIRVRSVSDGDGARIWSGAKESADDDASPPTAEDH